MNRSAKKDNANPALEFHTDIAAEWGDKYNNSPDFIERFKVWTNTLDQITSNDTTNILDVGCGTGIFSFYLAKKGFNVIGIDGSEGMIKACKENLSRTSGLQLDFLHHQLPIEPAVIDSLPKQDMIISSSVFEYIDDLEAVLDNLSQLLKPGGLFVMSFPNKHAIYRKIEKTVYSLTGKPTYLSIVKQTPDPTEIQAIMQSKGYQKTKLSYFAGNDPVSKLAKQLFSPAKTNNLYLIVFKKK